MCVYICIYTHVYIHVYIYISFQGGEEMCFHDGQESSARGEQTE